MNKARLFLLMLALLPMVVQAQADKKLIDKANQGDPAAMVKLGECYENGAGVPLDSTLALKWFQKAAEMGNGEGWLRISSYYLRGTLLPKDTARYFAIRKEWADKGLPNALAGLATAYEFGKGVKADTAKSIELLEQAVKKGSAWGLQNMGSNYYWGDCGVEQDQKKAASYWEKSYKLGNFDVIGSLVAYYWNIGDYKKAWKWVEEGKKWNEPDAITRAAMMYGQGAGVEKDEAMAQEILNKLIGQFHNLDIAQYMAGAYYMYPDSMALRDSAKAMRIWLDGDAKGMGLCQMALGRHFANNDQPAQAFPYFKKAADNKDNQNCGGDACQYLAQMCYQGTGCDTSIEQSLYWLERGVNTFKDHACAEMLANYYLEQAEDMPMAVKYLRTADKLGGTTAMQDLGLLYARNGNETQAAECFQKMIDDGNPDGYYFMGLLYDAKGDAKTCNSYMSKGDKAGSRDASAVMGMIYEKGLDGNKVNYKKAAEYYKRADTPKAHYGLATMYLNGHLSKKDGVVTPEDVTTGMDYMQTAASEGYIDAIYDLGRCYEYGQYVDSVNMEKAIFCYNLLAENGMAAGQLKMGIAYELGGGTLQADTAKALEYYHMAADQGNGEAMCYIGDFYRTGEFLPKDQQQAFSYYSQAHMAGEELGTFCVGRSYLEGCGVEIDTVAAVTYLKSAAMRGIGDAGYQVAEIYNYGKGGITADADSALLYYIKGHEGGNGDASYVIGRQLLREENYGIAVEYLYAGAKRQNVDAINTFAVCLQQGIGIDADPKEAYGLFEYAAKEYKSPAAYTQMGIACLQGNGCPEDEVLGRAYFDTAANMGHVLGMHDLALCYLNGYGCRVDTAAAIFWLEKAADEEKIESINELGDVYEAQGDFKNAVLYYEKAVAMGSLEGYCNLGYCYEQGQGVVLNSQKAYELYMYAAEHEYNRGYMCVANCYFNGIYVEENNAEGLKWLTKAAEDGNVLAMYYCGSILEKGEDGVEPDLKKAREWYKKAATAGYDPAAVALSRMRQ